MGKISKDYKFNYSQDYDYNNTVIQISGGQAKLSGTNSLYVTSDPFITTEKSIIANSINSFTEMATVGTGDILKYIVTVDGEDKYFDGTSWVSSNGTYAQSNLATEIQTNSSTIISGRARINLKAFLHSWNGSTTPLLDNINMSYNISFYCNPDDVRSQLVGIDKANLSDEEIVTFIENADSLIDFYIGMQYDLPITNATTLKLLRTWSSVIAAYGIYTYIANKEGSNIATLATSRYEKLIEMLEKISEGEYSLIGINDSSIFDSNFNDYKPTFNEGSQFNWGLDQNYSEAINDGSFYG